MDDIETVPLVQIRRQIEDSVNAPREQVEVDLWIESPGGDANAAYKLAVLLRHVARHIRVVIPDYAKSAATLLALVGDEIFLAPSAELGPLDAQLPQEGSFDPISALNIAKAADEVARDAVDLAIQGGGDMVNITGLSRLDTLSAMLRFSAEFSQALVCQLDPKLVHQAKELLRVTTRYAENLLKPLLGDGAQGVAQRLVEDFPTHGYVIVPEVARELGLPIKPIAEYDLLVPLRRVHRAAEDGNKIVRFVGVDEIVGKPSGSRGNSPRTPESESDEDSYQQVSVPPEATGAGQDGSVSTGTGK